MDHKVRSKKISKSGSLTIPSDIRRIYGFNNGDPARIEVQDDGSILIRPNKRVCLICTSSDDVVVLDGIAICKECVNKLAAIIKEKEKADKKVKATASKKKSSK